MKNQKLWFKAKRFGWGWQPTSWEGWLVTLLYIAAVVVHTQNISINPHTFSNITMNFLIPVVINTVFLLIICYPKGEKPRWRWGEK